MVHSIIYGEITMTARELIELLKTVDPDMEVVIEAPDSGYYTAEYYEYPIDKEAIEISFGKISIGVG
jgi:hypothetical protein